MPECRNRCPSRPGPGRSTVPSRALPVEVLTTGRLLLDLFVRRRSERRHAADPKIKHPLLARQFPHTQPELNRTVRSHIIKLVAEVA